MMYCEHIVGENSRYTIGTAFVLVYFLRYCSFFIPYFPMNVCEKKKLIHSCLELERELPWLWTVSINREPKEKQEPTVELVTSLQ